MNTAVVSLYAALACLGLVVSVAGCNKEERQAEPSAAAAPAPSRPTPPDAAPAPPVATVDCNAVLTEADLTELCGGALTLVTPAGDQDNIGPDRTCSRRFSDGDAGSLSLLLMKLEAPAPLSPAEPAWKNVKTLTGIGDEARSYEDTSRGGDPLYKLQLRKGDLDVLLFTSSMKPGSEPCVTSLEALGRRAVERLP